MDGATDVAPLITRAGPPPLPQPVPLRRSRGAAREDLHLQGARPEAAPAKAPPATPTPTPTPYAGLYDGMDWLVNALREGNK